MTLESWLRPRVRIVGSALAVGFVVGLAATTVLSVFRPGRAARTTVFALGTLAFGFGLLGWSGSIAAGRGIENMQTYLDTNTDWNEADSRRAMARVGSFGAGVMLSIPPYAFVAG